MREKSGPVEYGSTVTVSPPLSFCSLIPLLFSIIKLHGITTFLLLKYRVFQVEIALILNKKSQLLHIPPEILDLIIFFMVIEDFYLLVWRNCRRVSQLKSTVEYKFIRHLTVLIEAVNYVPLNGLTATLRLPRYA